MDSRVLVTVPACLEILLLSASQRNREWAANIQYVIFDEIHCLREGGLVDGGSQDSSGRAHQYEFDIAFLEDRNLSGAIFWTRPVHPARPDALKKCMLGSALVYGQRSNLHYNVVIFQPHVHECSKWLCSVCDRYVQQVSTKLKGRTSRG